MPTLYCEQSADTEGPRSIDVRHHTRDPQLASSHEDHSAGTQLLQHHLHLEWHLDAIYAESYIVELGRKDRVHTYLLMIRRCSNNA